MNGKAHAHHQDIAKRLKRAGGHLNKVISMIETKDSCTDIARQLQAVYKAIYNAKQQLIRDHIAHCLSVDALQNRPADQINTELAEITKYL